jgi:hypothetical protein
LKLTVLGKRLRESIKISAKESLGVYELKMHKPWFDEGCSELLDQRKQTKLQWLQDPREKCEDNLKYVRCENSRHFRNKKREYLKEEINERATNSFFCLVIPFYLRSVQIHSAICAKRQDKNLLSFHLLS